MAGSSPVPKHAKIIKVLPKPNGVMILGNGHLVQLISTAVILQNRADRTLLTPELLESSCINQEGDMVCLGSLQFAFRRSCETELMTDDMSGLVMLEP